ncbi:hypothetical protein [Aureispira sp. CCB-QB1]|uniref:hypothetical protein n=1 Tax=Aureispira sp. CCB-QB1 TaxID=1313421 RepID=UPI000698711C|nr:hypothetical protein [Aureispira sp. CCB-QB1]
MSKCFVIGLILCPMLLLGQIPATEEAFGKACACFDAIDFLQIDKEYLSTKADSCIEEALYTNLTGVLKENNTSLEDSGGMLKVAQKMHQYLLKNCTGFRKFAKQMGKEQIKEIKQEQHSNIGLLYDFNTNQQFPIITILTEKNETLEFIWFREFDGSTRFMNGIKPYKNTVVEIVWKDIELYDVVTQKYPFYKEIVLIEELNAISNKERKAWVKAYEKREKEKRKKR